MVFYFLRVRSVGVEEGREWSVSYMCSKRMFGTCFSIHRCIYCYWRISVNVVVVRRQRGLVF